MDEQTKAACSSFGPPLLDAHSISSQLVHATQSVITFSMSTPHVCCVSQVDVGLVGESGTGPDSALAVLLLSVVLVGVLDGLSQGAIFADAAALPPRYTHVSIARLHPCSSASTGSLALSRPASLMLGMLGHRVQQHKLLPAVMCTLHDSLILLQTPRQPCCTPPSVTVLMYVAASVPCQRNVP